ncbi:hypothetical protein [Microbispora bryophytorum]|nr:hypothetical protein [Microbispora bryophytorum]MBD3138535.1 hypothetical protein [Microbispora bryophytorum]
MGRWREVTAEFAGVLSSTIKPILSVVLVPYPRVVLRHRIRHAGRPR